MAEPDLSLAPPLTPTPEGWLRTVQANFDEFLKDHASCEKKASGMALAVASHYPDQPGLLSAMTDLAVEELSHYREVIRLMMARGVTPGADSKDPYINELNQHVRRGSANFLMDRLLVGAVVERRGAERFALIAEAFADSTPPAGSATDAHAAKVHEDSRLASFYRSIAASEHRHWELFYRLAQTHSRSDDVPHRFAELNAIEGAIMLAQPLRSALH